MEIVEKNLAGVYNKILPKLINKPDFVCSPRDQKIHEDLNVSFTITNPNQNLIINDERSSKLTYIKHELIWYLSQDLNPEYISKYASLWDKIKDENNKICSNYGNLLWTKHNGITQWNWALNNLIKDKDSRQAIIRFNDSRHQFEGNKDFVCTMYGIFHIRKDKLYFTVTMRSSDIIFGLLTDYVLFNIFHQQMLRHLQDYYPKLKIGTFTYLGNSLHVYERHFESCKKMLKSSIKSDTLGCLDVDLIDSVSNLTEEAKRFMQEEYSDSKFLDNLLDIGR